MKTDGIQTFIQLDKEVIEKLIAEVKETVAAIIHLPVEKNLFRTCSLVECSKDCQVSH